MRDFVDVYSQREIGEDQYYLATRKERFSRKFAEQTEKDQGKDSLREDKSKAMEILILELAELNNWLGENVFTFQTSEYDDVARGEDGVFEFDPSELGGTSLGLGVDFTFNWDDRLKSKLSRNVGRFLDGHSVKYFDPQFDGNPRGQFTIVPIVIALEQFNANDLLEMYISRERLAKKVEEQKTTGQNPVGRTIIEATNKQIEYSPIREIILIEIIEQLSMFQKIALTKLMDEKISKAIGLMLKMMRAKLKEIQPIFDQGENLRNDLALCAIQQETKKYQRQ